MKMMAQQRRTYSEKQREAVLHDVVKLGVSEAAKKHDVPKSCVSRWASVFGVRRGHVKAETEPDASKPTAKVAANNKPPARPAASKPAAKVHVEAPTARPAADEPAAAMVTSTSAELPVRRTLRSRVAKLYTPSQRAEILEYAAAHGATAAAEKFDVSRFSIYAWHAKVQKAASGQGKAPTSGPAPLDIEAQRDREILSEWHTHPGLGPSQIVNQLRRRNIKVSVNTARRVMEEAGYRPPKVKRDPHDERYEAVRPNHLWHLDFVHRHINRTSTFTLILIDDYSRFVPGHGVDDAERADMVIQTFVEATTRHGRPERVMHDKGSAFWSWRGISRFTQLLTEMGIDQVVAEHKEWNGKIEVFNANLAKELFDVHRFYDVAEMRRRLAAHLSWYNHARTHHALGGLLVPADRYYGRVDEVLARIEAGAGREAADLLDLRDRCLELFKVTSRAGVPEIWLLGKKLLGAPPPT